MNHSSLFYAGVAVVLSAALWCCTQPGPQPSDTALQKPALSATAIRRVDSISAATAREEERNWLDKRAALIAAIGAKNPDTIFLAKGFRVHKQDLTAMLNALNDTTTYGKDSIWALIGIRKGGPTLIFQDYDRRQRREIYYDFSKPCPPGTCE